MDNITHSLFGIATAKLINKKVNKDGSKKVSFFLYFVSIFAANFPDLDILMSLIEPGTLGYLLHHRGHTHTFVYLVPQVLILFGASVFAFRIKDKAVILAGLGLVSVNMVIHIFLDYQNSYGVHPFAPFDNTWYYNDNLFIIEPLLWFTMLPMVFTPIPRFFGKDHFLLSKRAAAGGLIWLALFGFFMAVLFLAFNAEYLGMGTTIFCGVLFILYIYLLNRKSDFTKGLVALISAVVVMNVFALSRNSALSAIHDNHKEKNTENIYDTVLSPMPANPFCWRFLMVTSDLKENFMIKSGAYRKLGWGPFGCPNGAFDHDAKLGKSILQNKAVYIESTRSGKLTDLTEDLGTEILNCRRDEWLQFARTPYRSKKYEYTDVRFERGTSNFTKIDVSDSNLKCLKYKVPWTPPRQDLIDGSLQKDP